MATNTNRNPEPFEKQMAAVFIVVMGLLLFFCSCSPRVVERVVTQIEYRDRVVHDTARVEIPYEVEKIVTRDTVSHLENSFAKSDAKVSGKDTCAPGLPPCSRQAPTPGAAPAWVPPPAGTVWPYPCSSLTKIGKKKDAGIIIAAFLRL